MKKTANIIGNIFSAVSVIFLLWLFISWAEVVCKNLSPNPQYWDLNAFTLFVEWAKVL